MDRTRPSLTADAGGHECDLVLPIGERLIPIKVKHASHLRPRDTAGIEAFMREYGEQAPSGILISLHPEVCRVPKRVWNLPLGPILNGTKKGMGQCG